MKKLQSISEKIEKTNNNYFGRGSFETIIKDNKNIVLSWLENLTPVQEQIRILEDEYQCENLQKRNYVRIITKIFPQEYNQFVCVNILLRDIDSITLAFSKVNNLKTQYSILINNNRLKFPGKHQKFVDFETYQQFVTIYTHDLINKSQDFETEHNLDFNIEEKAEKTEFVSTNIIIDKTEQEKVIESSISQDVTKEKIEEQIPIKKESNDKTNWMNVLLKGI